MFEMSFSEQKSTHCGNSSSDSIHQYKQDSTLTKATRILIETDVKLS